MNNRKMTFLYKALWCYYITVLILGLRNNIIQYSYRRKVHPHNSSVQKLQVIFPALDIRVKNVARTYSLEHKGENDLFEQLFELLNSDVENGDIFRRELASCTGAIHTSLSQHMEKEEEQVILFAVFHL